MKRGNKSNRIARSNAFREATTKKQSTYERDGFVFLFDDEELQKEYIHEYNHFNYEWEEKGNMHKRHLFQESVKENDGSQEISHFIKSTEKLFEELAEATKVADIVNKKQVKYNVVYYVRQVG